MLSEFSACMAIYFTVLLIAELVSFTWSCLMVFIGLTWQAIVIKCTTSESVEASVFFLSSLGYWSVVGIVISVVIVISTSVVVVSISINVIFFFKLILNKSLIFYSHCWSFTKFASGSTPFFLRTFFLVFIDNFNSIIWKIFFRLFLNYFFLFKFFFDFIEERWLVWNSYTIVLKDSLTIS